MSKVVAVVRKKYKTEQLEKIGVILALEKLGIILAAHRVNPADVEWIESDTPVYPELATKLLTSNIKAVYCTEPSGISVQQDELLSLLGAMAVSGAAFYCSQLGISDLMNQPSMLRVVAKVQR